MGCQWRADPPPGHRCESLPPLLLPSISHYAMHSPPSDITLVCHTSVSVSAPTGPDASFELFATLRFEDFEVGTTQSVPGACDIT